MIVTIYKNIRETKDGKFISIDKALERVKDGSSRSKVYLIRGSKDKKQRSKLKSELPSVCFSGTFSSRTDKALIEHSGFVVLDFDGIKNIKKKKLEISKDEYTYAVWVSPSGNGLKALIKIPKDKDKHENYYLALIDKYPELDTTSKNISRVCYESFDSEIYINKNSKIWDEQKEDFQKKEIKTVNTKTNYSKVENVLNIVRNAADNEKHIELLKASRLAGGFISGGYVDENEIIRLLESEISLRADDLTAAKVTIKKGIEHGKREPIQDEPKYTNTLEVKKEVIVKDNFISTKDKESDWLLMARENRIPQGLEIGSEHFDNHYRLKKKTMVGIFGIDNVGKTTFHHFLAVCYSKKHKVNWLFICKENAGHTVRQKLIELCVGKSLHLCSEIEYKEAKEFCYKYFDLIDDNYTLNIDNFFPVVKEAYSKKHYFAVFIDPYNSIQHEQTPNKNYAFLDALRVFQKEYDMSFHISMHISTEKARNFIYNEKDSIGTFEGVEFSVKGEMKIPRKNFVEGGQPIANKLDDIIMVHRLPKIMELRSYTLVSIDKVKEDKTGGMQSFEDPIMFKKSYPFDSFTDKNGVNPISNEKQQIDVNTNQFIEPNNDFDNLEDLPF